MTELTKQTYVHRYLVDGQIALSDFYDKPASKWRTALVGAQGAGGKSIFALDVARPNSFGAADVLWEFTHPELGHTLTTPVIARLPDGNWYALVANGFESLTCDNSQTPRYGVQNEVEPMPGQPKCAKVLNDGAGAAITARNAKLFIIKLTPKLDDGWTAGSDYHVIHATDVQTATKAPSTTASGPDNGSDNGLTGVAVAGTYAYAGDLQGNVWKFDLSAKALVKAGADGPVFVAIKDGKRQPISAAPAVTPYPNSTTDYCVNVGTGRYVYSGDMADQSIQSAYGVVDTLADTSGYSRADLQPQTIMAEGYFPATPPGPNAGRYYRTTTKTPVPAGKKGWYLDLQGTDGKPRGERVVDGLAVATASNPRWLLLNTETPVLFDCDARRYNRYFFMEACTGKRSEVFGLENGGGDPPPLAQDCVGAYCQCTGSSCQAEHTGPTPPGGECRDKGALTWVKDDCTQKVGLYYRACRSDSAAKGEIVQGPLSGVCAATKRRSWQQLR